MAKVICISTDRMRYSFQLRFLRYFAFYGFLDVAIISDYSEYIEVTNFQSVNGNMFALRNVIDGQSLFPDKLKNLNKFQYRIVLYDQPPRVVVKHDRFITPMMYFLKLFAEHQNALLHFTILKDPNLFSSVWHARFVDLTLNTAVNHPDSQYTKLLTYEESAYCALVPLSKKYEKFQLFSKIPKNLLQSGTRW